MEKPYFLITETFISKDEKDRKILMLEKIEHYLKNKAYQDSCS